MSVCTQAQLDAFGLQHYTYINQIFGDQTIREIISEIYPSHLQFRVEESEGFESAEHHVLYDPKKNLKICSVDNGYQDPTVDKNDTLCQSYSLLTYLGKSISTDKVKRQMDMIQMYRGILQNERFIKELDNVLYSDNKYRWRLYTRNSGYILMNKTMLIQNIHATLNVWEEYGYHYFIGNGVCPKITNRLQNANLTRTRSQTRTGNSQNTNMTRTRSQKRHSSSQNANMTRTRSQTRYTNSQNSNAKRIRRNYI